MICVNCSKQIVSESPVIDVCAGCFERRAQCVDRYYAALTEWRQITGSLGRPGLPNPDDPSYGLTPTSKIINQ